MSALALQTAPSLLVPPKTPSLTAHASRAKIAETAKAFEATFLSSMFATMFEGLSTAPPFGGGESEEAVRSFYTEAMAKDVVKHGGIGLAKHIQAEMLKLQGLPPEPPPVGATPKVNPAMSAGLASYQGQSL